MAARRWRVVGAELCIVVIVLALIGAPGVAVAQASAKTYQIGWLDHGGPPFGATETPGTFSRVCATSAMSTERTSWSSTDSQAGNVERLAGLAAELVRLPVNVIVISGEPAALAAMRATNSIPIVTTEIGIDPVKAGLVASLARPGGNVTGLASLSNDLWQKRMALLKVFAPRASRVAVLWNPANPGNADFVAEIKAAAPSLGMQPRYLEVSNASALEGACPSIAKEPAGALVTCLDSVTLERAGSTKVLRRTVKQ